MRERSATLPRQLSHIGSHWHTTLNIASKIVPALSDIRVLSSLGILAATLDSLLIQIKVLNSQESVELIILSVVNTVVYCTSCESTVYKKVLIIV